MVTFDHRDDGTPESAWLASPRWRSVPRLDLDGVDRLVVLSAHPDDESLGAAGLLARASERGIAVRVVVATDGAASHPFSPTTTPQMLADLRRAELTTAIAAVAPEAGIDFLGLPDGALREHADELRVHLSSLHVGPGTLVLAPWRADRHGDHEVAGTIAAAVAVEAGARLVEYPVWLWHWSTPHDAEVPWGRFATLELTEAERVAKRAAIDAHRTQNSPLSPAAGDETLLDAAFLEHFARPFETFIGPAPIGTLTEHFFDAFYDGSDDPWGFETRWYEIRKRAVTLASLPRPLFTSALEIGCSIGVLTAELAGRCATLLATDIAEQPLARARARLSDQSHVSFVRADAAAEWPSGSFDLIVLSEVGYYWSPADLARVLQRIERSLTPDGIVVACHWRHPVEGYPERGDDVHATIRAVPGFAQLVRHEEEDFLLDVFARPPGRSVASETGLV